MSRVYIAQDFLSHIDKKRAPITIDHTNCSIVIGNSYERLQSSVIKFSSNDFKQSSKLFV